MKVVQFLPYFPPHKGGLETHAKQWSDNRKKFNYGQVVNVFSSVGQDGRLQQIDKKSLIFDDKKQPIGYHDENNNINLILPSFDIIGGFPFMKFWTKKFWFVLKYIKEFFPDIVVTRTRFFLTSFVGGLWARRFSSQVGKGHKFVWCHIEHGSDYVKLGSKIYTKIAYIYDKLIGKRVFKNANLVVPISYACKKFVNKFINKDLSVIYRGVDIPNLNNKNYEIKNKFPNKFIVGYVGRVYKWKNVDGLIKAYYELKKQGGKNKEIFDNLQLVVVGDGEYLEECKKLDTENRVYFTGGVDFEKSVLLQSEFDIHVHCSGPGGGLASTGLQAMALGCMIVSTPFEGMNEVVEDMKNGILLKDDSVEEIKRGIQKAVDIYDQKKDEFAQYNKDLINQQFDWKNNIKKYYELFNKTNG